jgi:hypothetical protein
MTVRGVPYIMNQNDNLKLRPYSMKELAALYGVSTKTLRSWLESHEHAIGLKISRYFTVHQVKIIFEKIGLPG